jgi:exopolysaccharide biosynthesis polyprenyl glycosylphosphotransferase
MMSKQPYTRSVLGAADSLIALVLVVGAVVWANERRMPQGGLGEFLEMRITPLNASFAIVFAVIWQQCMQGLGLYRRFAELLRPALLTAAGVGFMTALLALYLAAIRVQGPVPPTLLGFFIAAFSYQMARVFLSNPRLGWMIGDPEQVVIVGSGRRAAKAWRNLRVQHHGAKCLLGFVDDRDIDLMPPDIAGRLLGRVDDLPDYLLRNAVDELIVAAPARSCYDMTQRAVAMAEAAGVRVVCLNDLYNLIHDKKLRQRADMFTELVPRDEAHLFAEAVKRALDVAVAAACLVLLAPLFLVIALAIKLSSPGPVFFLQERYGWRRRRFRMWKFRSMVRDAPRLMAALETQNEADGPIFKITNDPRVTHIGRWLRRTSLDELPQLWNVLLGDMSLVGPRPMTVRDVSLFSEAQLMRRFRVRPGMTGSWQVAARGSFSFDQWIELDFAYIDDWSLGLDLKILARTLPAVLRRSGAV